MPRELWLQLHWWIGISAGAVLAVLGATGALLSFEPEIVDWLNRDVRRVSAPAPGAVPLGPPALLERIAAQRPGQAVLSLSLSADPRQAVAVTLAAAGPAESAPARGRRERRYADPITGGLSENAGERGADFFGIAEDVHRRLALNLLGGREMREVGGWITGACSIGLAILAFTGIALRLPRRWRGFAYWFGLNLRKLRGRVLLWRLHAVSGTWLLVVLLFPALTGPQWSYDWYQSALRAALGVERPERAVSRGEARPRAAREDGAGALDLRPVWERFLDETQQQDVRRVQLRLRDVARRGVEIRYLTRDAAHDRAVNRLVLDPRTGAVRSHRRYDDLGIGEQLAASIFALHTGSFFGWPGRIAVLIASLACPFFFVTGWILHRGRVAARRKAATRAPQSPAAPASGNLRVGA